jgi:PIN domain nuclease of toxin-antitoxin system
VVLLDTHVWVWWLTPASPLSRRERSALDALAERRELAVSAISLWETQMLQSKGRLELPLSLSEWSGRAVAAVETIVPLNLDVVLEADALSPKFHGDPADRIIVATARALAIELATHDSAIRRSRLVRLWAA